jgi:hypothetical protein
MIADPSLVDPDDLAIVFSSLIGCSFILEEAVKPEKVRKIPYVIYRLGSAHAGATLVASEFKNI